MYQISPSANSKVNTNDTFLFILSDLLKQAHSHYRYYNSWNESPFLITHKQDGVGEWKKYIVYFLITITKI